MRTRKGALCAIDRVQLTEASIAVVQEEVALKGTFLLMNDDTLSRFGAANRNVWSPRTLMLLRQLLDSMEDDELASLFPGTTTDSAEPEPVDTSRGVPGL